MTTLTLLHYARDEAHHDLGFLLDTLCFAAIEALVDLHDRLAAR